MYNCRIDQWRFALQGARYGAAGALLAEIAVFTNAPMTLRWRAATSVKLFAIPLIY